MSRNISPRARQNPLRWETHRQVNSNRWHVITGFYTRIIILIWSFVADGRWRRHHTCGVRVDFTIDPRASERISVSIIASGRISVVNQFRINPARGYSRWSLSLEQHTRVRSAYWTSGSGMKQGCWGNAPRSCDCCLLDNMIISCSSGQGCSDCIVMCEFRNPWDWVILDRQQRRV